MSVIFSAINRLFDWIFLPFEALNPLYGLVAVSLLTGVFMLLVFRYVSNQRAIRKTKDQIKAQLLAVRLFQDQIGVVLGAHLKLLGCTLNYMKHSLRPLAVMIIPIVVIMVQLEIRLGHRPIAPGGTFLLTAVFIHRDSLADARLELPPGLRLVAPPVHIPDQREISWKLRAERPGQYESNVIANEKTFSKKIVVANSVFQLSHKRLQGNLWDFFLNPGEPLLQADGPIKLIEVKYPKRKINLGFFWTHWLVPFFVFSLLTGLVLKGVLGTEI